MSLGSVATTVYANSFTITRLPSKSYYQYDVVFIPELKNSDRRIQFIQHLQNVVAPNVFNPRVVYDGRALAYSPGRVLPLAGGTGETFSINLNSNVQAPQDSRGSFQIRFSQTSGVPIQPGDVNPLIHHQQQSTGALTATNLLQLIIRQGPNLHNTNNGRAYFPNDRSQIRDIGGALELWRGIYHSVRPSPQKMILTIDTCTAAVYLSGDLRNVALSFLGVTDIRALNLTSSDPKFKQLERFLNNVRISVPASSGRRTKTIRGLIEHAGKFIFSKNDGQESTVARHFQETHNIRIQYLDIIGVNISGKNNPHPSVIPAELCQVIPGQLYKRKVPEYLTAKVVDFAKIKPQDRFRKITQSVEAYHRSEFVVESGMQIDTQPLQVLARRLNVPRVLYGVGGTANVRDGGWNVLGKQLNSPKMFNSWAVIDFVADKLSIDDIKDRVRSLSACCQQLAIGPSVPPLAIERGNPNSPEESLTKLLKNVQSRAKPEAFILIVILPNSAGPIRNAVKHWGDVRYGVMTQCLRLEKFMAANNQYWNNVALKINARLGGCNSSSESGVLTGLQKEPFMIVGADVGHPGPGVAKPSVTGIVFSYDQGATRYAAVTEIQQPRVEVIESLQGMMEKALGRFIEFNKMPPKRLIFFRDGVSEGEYNTVATAELAAIKAAIQTIVAGRNYSILVTFIVVGKRHHSVFFPRNNEGDKKGNCHPGLVVEDEVTGPMRNDFYLQSHAAIQGTPRSAHYIVLHDDIFNGNKQKIQELAFTLCHVYAKATRSVSIPAPVYYADLVCARGVFHMSPEAHGLQFDDSASSSSGGLSFDLDNWRSAFMSVNRILGNRMYFL
ncbi:argonaute-like protein [Phlegmacium glaucopus]|nr:argonaute-like protein [Phlegmacium glaucopus]